MIDEVATLPVELPEEETPAKVSYSDIDRVINERKPELIEVLLPQAVAYEEWELLNVTLPKYAEDLAEYNDLISGLDPEELRPEEPVQPELDLSIRRKYYTDVTETYDKDLYDLIEYSVVYDDDNYTASKTPRVVSKEDSHVMQVYQARAKALRTEIIDSDIETLGSIWQVGSEDRENIKEALELMEYLGSPIETTQDWILKDNTIRPTTAEELKQVLVAYGMRKKAVFEAYMIWRSQGVLEPFEF